MTRLTTAALPSLTSRLPVPEYPRDAATTGIVHFGVGAFHRSHEAMFLDRLFRSDPSAAATWGICGVGLLPGDAAMRDTLQAQDHLYTLVTRSPDGEASATVIGSIMDYLFAPDDPNRVVERLASAQTRIASLTITEAGYPVDDSSGAFDETDAAVATDLAAARVEGGPGPSGVFGILTEALRRRRDRGLAAFTVMSCDNIPGNGTVARVALTSYARLIDADLADWIEATVAFPNSMVDRITPATTDAGRAEVASRWGVDDAWPVLSESFEQWVLEDAFPLGRPAFEKVGVQIVPDVEPYELMKLRLLNASHQAMSYLGLLAGFTTVHDTCRDEGFRAFLLGYMHEEAIPTLDAVPGIDLDAYCRQLLERFSSEAIADTLARQVVEGSARIPKFLLPVLRDQLVSEGPIERICLVVAAWSVYLSRDEGVVDSRHDRIVAAARREESDPGALLDVAEVFGDLGSESRFRARYLSARGMLLAEGPIPAISALAAAGH
ncbi:MULTISPECIES: mannitol dehydrogenase family protein [unclassified Frondihabitans]|uniref:mannitol dehydrogenase family protein n=1 Tax=unclassified Frondihabitans TaxID=2626248 RepID=UPI000F4D44D4|nr:MULTISPECIES: mannitol dehydrogenase family protein [unclassified Frondihabitans]RPE78487.1 mannitol 2-dehydrogenase [Frondihabitans sp. PhB153]RPF08768.1 mannitol 2-dehydrogenase [Frondihabitans sp. PhB161]